MKSQWMEGARCAGEPHGAAEQGLGCHGAGSSPRSRRPQLWVKGGVGVTSREEKESLPDLFFPMGSLKKRRKSVSRARGQLGCWLSDKPTQESTAVLALVGPPTSLNQLMPPWASPTLQTASFHLEI